MKIKFISIFLLVILFLQIASATETKVTIKTLAYGEVQLTAYKDSSKEVLYHVIKKADKYGDLEVNFDVPNDYYKLLIYVRKNNKFIDEKGYLKNNLEAGKNLYVQILPPGVNPLQNPNKVENKTKKNQTIEKINIPQNNQTNIPEKSSIKSNEKNNKNNFLGLELMQLIYIIIAIILLVTAGFSIYKLKKKKRKEIKIVKLSEKKKQEKENEEDEIKEIEEQIKELQDKVKEIKEKRGKSKKEKEIEKAKKRLLEDEKRLLELRK